MAVAKLSNHCLRLGLLLTIIWSCLICLFFVKYGYVLTSHFLKRTSNVGSIRFGAQWFHRCYFDNNSLCSFSPLSSSDVSLIDEFIAPENPLTKVYPFQQLPGLRTSLFENADGLAYCPIPKAGVTIVQSLQCSLALPESYPFTLNTDNDHLHVYVFWEKKECHEKLTYLHSNVKSISDREILHRVVVVREPFERVMSAWSNQCLFYGVCPGACKSIGCLLDHMETALSETIFNVHYVPQAWQCSLLESAEDNRVILLNDRSHAFLESWLHLLASSNVNKSVMPLAKQLLQSNTKHTTIGTPGRTMVDEEVLTSATLLRKVLRIYYLDYQKLRIPLSDRVRQAILGHLKNERKSED